MRIVKENELVEMLKYGQVIYSKIDEWNGINGLYKGINSDPIQNQYKYIDLIDSCKLIVDNKQYPWSEVIDQLMKNKDVFRVDLEDTIEANSFDSDQYVIYDKTDIKKLIDVLSQCL